MVRRAHARSRVVLLVLAATVAAGCSSTEAAPDAASGERAASGTGDIKVIEPGRPGEAAKTLDPEDVATPDSQDDWNHADVAFVQMMVPHHGQALEMSRLATSRASNEQVLSLARRIRGAQGPEIVEMAAWLEARDLDVPKAGGNPSEYDHGSHGHSTMAGMLTEEQMEELTAARGRRFDRLFLKRMIGHHSGAVDMAQDVAREGTDVRVAEIAADVAAGQSAEIQRMRELLEAL